MSAIHEEEVGSELHTSLTLNIKNNDDIDKKMLLKSTERRESVTRFSMRFEE